MSVTKFVYQPRPIEMWAKRCELPLRGINSRTTVATPAPVTPILPGKKIDGALQENILTLLCFDTESCQTIIDKVDTDNFDNDVYRTIADRVKDYFRKYKRAPADHLPDLVEKELLGKKATLYVDALHDLHGLSEGINREYVLDQLQEFVDRQVYINAILRAAEGGRTGDVQAGKAQLLKHLERVGQGQTGGLLEALNAATHTYEEFRTMEFPPVVLAMDPVVQFPGITHIRGFRNHFKTGLIHCLAVSLASGKDLWGWKCNRAYKVVLLDGELPPAMVQNLLKAVCADLGVRWRAVRKNLHIASKSEIEKLLNPVGPERLASGVKRTRLNLADPKQTDTLVEYLTQYDIAFFDSIKTLVHGVELKEGKGWETIDDLCLRCRYDNTSIVRNVHMGKNLHAGSRGASDQEDIPDLVVQVQKTTGEDHYGNPRIKVTYPKPGRDQDPKSFVPLELELATSEGGFRQVRRIGAGGEKGKAKKPSKMKQIVPVIKDLMRKGEWGGKDDITQKEFGKTYEAEKTLVSKAAKKAREELDKEQSLIHE